MRCQAYYRILLIYCFRIKKLTVYKGAFNVIKTFVDITQINYQLKHLSLL